MAPLCAIAAGAGRRLALAGLLFAVAGAAFAAPQTHVVTIEAMKFSPEVVQAKAGDTIVWQNKDFFPHTATAQDGRFDSKSIEAGGSWKVKLVKPGEVGYGCTLHPTMKGRLVVK